MKTYAFTTTNGSTVDPAVAVVNGVASVDINLTVTEDGHSQSFMWARAGQAVSAGRLAEARQVALGATALLTGTLTTTLDTVQASAHATRYLPLGATVGTVRGAQNLGNDTVTVAPQGADTIDGGTDAYRLDPGKVIRLQSDGSGAWVEYASSGSGAAAVPDGSITLPKLSTGVQTSIGKADGAAQKASNLSDVANASTARTNLGLGTAATQASTAFDAAGAATAAQAASLQKASNLSDLASASTTRTNLGLGTAATLASSAVAQTANNLSDVANAGTARTNLGLGTAATMTPATLAADTALTGTYARRLVAPAATGIAATDTANIQALIDQGASSSTVVIDLPPSQNYSINELVPKSGVVIQGNSSKLTATTGSVQGIINNRTAQVPVDHFEVYNVEFVGQGIDVGLSTERRGAVLIYNGKHIKIRDCVAHDFNYWGFGIINGQDVWLQNNELYNVCAPPYGNALHITLAAATFSTTPEATSRAVITGNTVRNCHTAAVCVQATLPDSGISGTVLDHDVVVADNPYLQAVVEDVAGHGFAAIALEIGASAGLSSAGIHVRRVHVHHNNCYVTGTSGASSPTTWGISVTDNNGGNGAQSTDWDEFCDIIIDHNAIDSIDGGIISQASRSMIDHNVIRANLRGIQVSYNNAAGHLPEQIQVDGNLIHLDATKAVGAGVYAGTVASVTIQGNRIYYYGSPTNGQTPLSNGIYANGSSNVVVFSNTVLGSTRNGVHLLSVTDYTVERNRIRNPSSGATNTYDALRIESTTGNAIAKGGVRHNEFVDDRGAGIMMSSGVNLLSGTHRAQVVGNRIAGYGGGSVTNPGAAYWIAQNDIGGSHPAAPATISVTASPFTYTVAPSSSTPYPQEVTVQGGTVTKIEKKRSTASAIDTGLTQGIFRLEASDALVVTYSVAPTMKLIPAV